MKDSEARERIQELEDAVRALPQAITEAVTATLQPADTQLRAQVEELQFMLAKVAGQLESLEAAVKAKDGTELLEVVESELNALRVDVNAQRETIVDVAAQTGKVADRVTRITDALARVASSG